MQMQSGKFVHEVHALAKTAVGCVITLRDKSKGKKQIANNRGKMQFKEATESC